MTLHRRHNHVQLAETLPTYQHGLSVVAHGPLKSTCLVNAGILWFVRNTHVHTTNHQKTGMTEHIYPCDLLKMWNLKHLAMNSLLQQALPWRSSTHRCHQNGRISTGHSSEATNRNSDELMTWAVSVALELAETTALVPSNSSISPTLAARLTVDSAMNAAYSAGEWSSSTFNFRAEFAIRDPISKNDAAVTFVIFLKLPCDEAQTQNLSTTTAPGRCACPRYLWSPSLRYSLVQLGQTELHGVSAVSQSP